MIHDNLAFAAITSLGKMEAWQWWGAKNPEDALKDLGSGVALECVFGRIWNSKGIALNRIMARGEQSSQGRRRQT